MYFLKKAVFEILKEEDNKEFSNLCSEFEKDFGTKVTRTGNRLTVGKIDIEIDREILQNCNSFDYYSAKLKEKQSLQPVISEIMTEIAIDSKWEVYQIDNKNLIVKWYITDSYYFTVCVYNNTPSTYFDFLVFYQDREQCKDALQDAYSIARKLYLSLPLKQGFQLADYFCLRNPETKTNYSIAHLDHCFCVDKKEVYYGFFRMLQGLGLKYNNFWIDFVLINDIHRAYLEKLY